MQPLNYHLVAVVGRFGRVWTSKKSPSTMNLRFLLLLKPGGAQPFGDWGYAVPPQVMAWLWAVLAALLTCSDEKLPRTVDDYPIGDTFNLKMD